MLDDEGDLYGLVTWELRDEHGNLKGSGQSRNRITDQGDQVYATNVCGGATVTPLTKPTGMQLGQGSTAVAKSGAGAAIVTYLTTSDHTFDSGKPTAVNTPSAGTAITYQSTYAAGEATAAGAITEAAIVNKTLVANGAGGGSAAAAVNTISRVLLAGIGSKAGTDVLTVTWTHTLLGA